MEDANSLGQGIGWAYSWAGLLLGVLYAAKFPLVRLAPKASVALALYCLVALLCLPYIYVLVTLDWHNTQVLPIGCWVGDPVMLLFVPTGSLVLDPKARTPPRVPAYALRSLLEVVVLIPLRVVCWTFLQFVLGWVWI